MPELTVKKRGKNYVLYNEGVIRIDDCRASYPHLAKPYAGKNNNDDDKKKTPKFSIHGLMSKQTHVEAKDALKAMIDEMLKANDVTALSPDRKFLRNGDEHEEEVRHGNWTVSAAESRRPAVRNRQGILVDQADIESLIYPGCYVNILIRPWYQNGTTVGAGYGKRVNASLVAVQFNRDGERIGEGAIDDTNAWDTDDAGSKSSSDDDL